MTDKEKIYNDVENLLDSPAPSHDSQCNWEDGYWCALYKVQEIIDALSEEPVSEDLEKAAKRYATEGDEISGLFVIKEEVYAFEAGAKWQKKQTINEVCKWLEDHLFEYDQYAVISIDAKEVVDDLKKAMEE